LSSFSQYGATTVDLGAPGSGILSTVPISSKRGTISGYASYNGTSMATPHVTGAAALYASINSGSTAAQIKTAILGAATPTPSLAGKCVTGGRLNVAGF
jgi:subtilisin family serine protease